MLQDFYEILGQDQGENYNICIFTLSVYPTKNLIWMNHLNCKVGVNGLEAFEGAHLSIFPHQIKGLIQNLYKAYHCKVLLHPPIRFCSNLAYILPLLLSLL